MDGYECCLDKYTTTADGRAGSGTGRKTATAKQVSQTAEVAVGGGGVRLVPETVRLPREPAERGHQVEKCADVGKLSAHLSH